MNLKADLLRIFKIFYDPHSVFRSIRDKDEGIVWLTPFIFIIIGTVVYSLIVVPHVIIPEQIERMQQNDDLEEDVLSSQIGYLETSYHFYTSIFAEVGKQLFYYLILAFILSSMQIILGGKKASYGHFFSGVVYVGIIKTAGLIIQGYMQYQQSSSAAGTHLAAVFTEITGFGRHFLHTLNLFSLWQVILLAIMLQVIYGYSKKKSYIVMFFIWFSWNIVIAYFSNLAEIVRSE